MSKKTILIKISLSIIAILLLSAIAYFSFFIWKAYSTGRKITLNVKNDSSLINTLKSFTSPTDSLEGASSGRINILLLGTAGKGKPGQYLTDTIIVASVNTQTNQVALLSIPRDLYVKNPLSGDFTKINAIYQSALNQNGNDQAAAQAIESTIKDITNLDINYYVVVNFDGFEKFIDTIGGVNVDNDRDILDTRYPGPNYSYETFELKKGFHQLDGKTALKYARVRHGDPEGDFGRAKRQQQIMQAAKNKLFSTKTLLNIPALNEIFNNIGDNVRTDISTTEFEPFLELLKKLDTNNINNVVLSAWDKDSLLKVSHVFYGNTRAFVVIPRAGNYSEIQDLSQNIFDLNKLKRRRDEIAQENASIVIINKSSDNNLLNKIKKLLSDNFDYKNVTVINDNQNLPPEDTTFSYDLTNGLKPFTLDELANKLPATPSYTLPEKYRTLIAKNNPDVVIVLGKDLIDRYNMEEDSFDDYKNSSDTNEYQELLNQ